MSRALPELVGIGDLHLTDSAGKGGLSAYIEDHDDHVAQLVIDQPLAYARRKSIRHILLYGDLCENPRMSYAGHLALGRILSEPFNAKTGELFEFHIILGNHDMFDVEPSAGHSMDLVKLWGRPNVKLYEKPTNVKVAGLPVRFLPFPHQSFHPTALNVAHVDVAGSKTDSGRLNEGEHLSASKATCVIGHIHTSQRVRNSHYSGTLYQTNFGESMEKFFHHISFDDGWVIEKVPVKPTYRLHTVTVESAADLKGVPSGKHDLVKLILVTSKVKSVDYQHLNVVKTVPVKNSAEAVLAQFEEIGEGQQIEISPTEFFNEWVDRQTRPDPLKKAAKKLRHRLLQGVAK